MGSRDIASILRQRVWSASVPLEIRLHGQDCATYDQTDPYLVQFPRLSYLAFLLPNLHTFFYSNLIYPHVSPAAAWFEFEGVPLKWHYPLGLLYDLYAGAEPASSYDTPGDPLHAPAMEDEAIQPWKLTLHFSDYPEDQLVKLDAEGKHLHDLFINNVKEADFLRNGNGKAVMYLSKDDSEQLWKGVRQHDFGLFHPIYTKLLSPQGGAPLKNLPVRLYLPHAANPKAGKPDPGPNPDDQKVQDEKGVTVGSVRVVQALVPRGERQKIGSALSKILPGVIGTRNALLAQPVLHGAIVPLGASVEELIRAAAYLDGWLHIAMVPLT